MEYPIDTVALAEFAATAEPTPTEAQVCADLARAIFPSAEIIYGRDGSVEVYIGEQSSGTGGRVFNPLTSAEDKDAMAAWLAQQGNLICSRFWGEMDRLMGKPLRLIPVNGTLVYSPLDYLTASRSIIARAAWLAIQGRCDE